MKVKHEKEIIKEKVVAEGAKDAHIQWLISEKDNAPNFALRRLTVGPGGSTPLHKHDYEHETYVLSGKGELFFEGKKYELEPNKFAFIDANKIHQFINNGEKDLVFLCIIPL